MAVSRSACALLAALLLPAEAARVHARDIEVPVRFDHELLRQAVREEIYTGADGEAVVWDDGTGCGSLVLRDPRVDAARGLVRLVTRAESRLGRRLLGLCVRPFTWSGTLEIFEEALVTPDRRAVEFRVVESNVYDEHGEKGLLTGWLWDLVKGHVHPRLEAVRLDLAGVVAEIGGALPFFLPPDDAEQAAAVVGSLRVGSVAVDSAGVRVALQFDVPGPPPTPGAPAAEPALRPVEIEAWERAWQRWDAFLTFVVKHLAGEPAASALRPNLGDVLLVARHDIVAILAAPTPEAGDPVPGLFLETWDRLAPVVRELADRSPLPLALRYTSFIGAADALAALARAGPEMGLEISADGLRRLARIVAPDAPEDPLEYGTEVDPELRRLLGFGPPLPPPDVPVPEPISWWRRVLDPVRPAHAADEPGRPRLETWLPKRREIDAYLERISRVLASATDATLERHPLAGRQRQLYRDLVPATAWQESCWRQFVLRAGQIAYLRSSAGSVGLMQVNETAWRGLYDRQGLRWDVAYNARAGAEILMHYLRDYAIARREDRRDGGFDNLARATYAVYNGGPRHLARYRSAGVKPSLRRIDDLFWTRYERVRAGRMLEVRRCLVGA
jgi:hypothetical protein